MHQDRTRTREGMPHGTDRLGRLPEAAVAALALLLFMAAVYSTGVAADEASDKSERYLSRWLDDGDDLYLYGGVYAHFGESDDYKGPPIAGGLELRKESDWLFGVTVLNNSYSQFSQYLYFGKRFNVPYGGLHAKLTAGALHGYHGRFRGKIPFNHYGVAPVIIPSVGKDFGRVEANVVIFGFSGAMLTVGYDLWD